jgi:hypothetical protein
LKKDPIEMHNLYGDPASAAITKQLRAELYRLKKELKDNDQAAFDLPKDDVDGQEPPVSTR